MPVHDLIEEWDTDLRSADPLDFPGYAEKLDALEGESVRTGRTAHYVAVDGDFDVLGGSMGVVHGEKVVRAFDRAVALGLPVVVTTRTGGARMQEGMISLVQMARCAAAARRHADAGLLSVAVHDQPTTGGVLASYASLCDLRAAVAGATVGFAGPRVVEQTVGESVEGRSHTAETALAAGLVDAVLEPGEVRGWVEAAVGLVDRPLALRPLPDPEPEPPGDASSAWHEVLRARRVGRPTGVDVAARLCQSWVELAGTDPTVRVGLARVAGRRAVVVAHDRYARLGRPRSAGFRLARRGVFLAARLGLPVVTLVDTPGADPGPESENDGVAGEIARLFSAMAALPTPSVGLCVGEGGSGGALAFCASDRLLVQRHAVFSVIGPEGAAAILEHDSAEAPDVAELLGLTSADLLRLGVVDEVVPDDTDGACRAVVDALDAARVGERRARFDRASAAHLRSPDA